MSWLIQRCKFDYYRRYAMLVKSTKTGKSRVPSHVNLNGGISRCLYNASSMSILDDKTKRCLDYIADEYKNETWMNNDLLDFIDWNVAGGLLTERIKLVDNIRNLQDLAKQDVEMKKLVKEEEVLYTEQLNELNERLLNAILSNISKEHYDSIIIEIVTGVGGQEAMLFVRDLYEMYIGYAKYLGISHEVLEMDVTDNDGVRNVSIMVSGERASKFRHEGGVHRVQRIPITEKSGRVHTSTASVAIVPAPTEVQVKLDERDLKIETKRASGAGGQHVNTTDSAVRITHTPTGIIVNCQTNRSQIKNKTIALTKLRSILYEQQLQKQTSFTSELRRKQMGMGTRNEKVRTYNYNQDRVTDHRLQNGTMHNLKEFMQGGAALEELEDRLHEDMRMKALLEIVRKLETQIK